MAKPAKIKLDHTLVKDLGEHMVVPGMERDMFGVEVELEGRKITADTIKYNKTIYDDWTLHLDGSLRVRKPGDEATEYVFRKPLNLERTAAAISNLFEYLTTTEGVQVYDSYRTSIHVHINCLQDTIRTIVNFITLAIIFDELFVSQNGETRIGNNFCLRSRDAEGQIAELVKSIQHHNSLYNLAQENRYSSVNYASLLKFGTIEFRSLECTTDYVRVMHWINTIHALKKSARTYTNPQQIMAEFSRRGAFGFMLKNLGEQSLKYSKVPDYSGMLTSGMRLAQDFAFCSEWVVPAAEDLTEVKPKKKVNPKFAAVEQVAAEPQLYWHGPNNIHAQYMNQLMANAAPPAAGQHLAQAVAAVQAGGAAQAGPQPHWFEYAPAHEPLAAVADDDDDNQPMYILEDDDDDDDF